MGILSSRLAAGITPIAEAPPPGPIHHISIWVIAFYVVENITVLATKLLPLGDCCYSTCYCTCYNNDNKYDNKYSFNCNVISRHIIK